jgi:mannose-6-phosphate isomerase-like protein (cupin superfamily)
MKIIKMTSALKGLKTLSDEIRHAECIKTDQFTSGLIAFRKTKNRDAKQINHDDKDVLCQVVKGTGRLRINGKRIPLTPGIVCHIPKGTPHDFAAARKDELVLFYCLVRTG